MEMSRREYLIDYAEGAIGVMSSVPWHKISTEDLERLVKALNSKCYGDGPTRVECELRRSGRAV